MKIYKSHYPVPGSVNNPVVIKSYMPPKPGVAGHSAVILSVAGAPAFYCHLTCVSIRTGPVDGTL